jgi:hypothetical protein
MGRTPPPRHRPRPCRTAVAVSLVRRSAPRALRRPLPRAPQHRRAGLLTTPKWHLATAVPTRTPSCACPSPPRSLLPPLAAPHHRRNSRPLAGLVRYRRPTSPPPGLVRYRRPTSPQSPCPRRPSPLFQTGGNRRAPKKSPQLSHSFVTSRPSSPQSLLQSAHGFSRTQPLRQQSSPYCRWISC